MALKNIYKIVENVLVGCFWSPLSRPSSQSAQEEDFGIRIDPPLVIWIVVFP